MPATNISVRVTHKKSDLQYGFAEVEVSGEVISHDISKWREDVSEVITHLGGTALDGVYTLLSNKQKEDDEASVEFSPAPSPAEKKDEPTDFSVKGEDNDWAELMKADTWSDVSLDSVEVAVNPKEEPDGDQGGESSEKAVKPRKTARKQRSKPEPQKADKSAEEPQLPIGGEGLDDGISVVADEPPENELTDETPADDSDDSPSDFDDGTLSLGGDGDE